MNYNRPRRRPNYDYPTPQLPGLTGPTDIPPISPGGTIAIDTNENIRTGAAGYWTDEDKRRALERYGASDAFYGNAMQDGGWNDGMIDSAKGALSSEITQQGGSIASAINSALSQRGLGANVYAGQQAKQRAAFGAAGAVGKLDYDIKRNQLENKFAAAGGSASNAGAEASLYRSPTQESAMNMIHKEAELPTSDWGNGGGYGGGGGFGGGGGVLPSPIHGYRGGFSDAVTTRAKRYNNYSDGSGF